MLQNLWLKARPYWLVFLRDLKQMFTPCRRCGEFGAYPCSIAGCVLLCTACQKYEHMALDLKHYQSLCKKETHINGVNITGGTYSAPFGKWSKRK